MNVAILENIQFGILSDKDILRQSVCEISNTKLTGPSSIYDERMGILENAKLCVTCNKNNKECIGHFGHIKLNVSIAHPLFYKSILSVLRCMCYRCSRILMTKDQFEFHGLLKYQKQSRFLKVLKILEKMDTCLLCHTLQPKYVLSVTDKSISMVFKIDGEPRKNIMYDYEIKKIFENMTDEDVDLLGFDPAHSHPKNLIIDILPVLPPVARPYIISDNVTCDDDLTIQYLEIIKANCHLVVDSSMINEVKRQRYMQSLKFRIKCLFDNSQERSKHSNGRPLKGIKKRLTGKEGQLRNNLMGKRVDKSARTVIGPDPTLKVNEIAIPYEIADTLTYPVKVTSHNIEELTAMLYHHKINYVIRKGSSQRINMKYALYKQSSRLHFGDYIRKLSGEYIFIKNEKQFFLLEPEDTVIRNGTVVENFQHPSLKHFTLSIGDTVERKLRDNDILLLNRQPTLHKGSMMAFHCKLRKGKTIRTNLAITKSFNADFDGDEMNLHAPNSVETETELRLLSTVQNHIISNQSNKPNIVIVQDGLLAAYLISSHDREIPRHQFMNMLTTSIGDHTTDWVTRMEKKQRLFREKCPLLPELSGKLLFSFLLPDDFSYSHGDVVIQDGILVQGKITKTQLGSSHQSFIAIFYNMYGASVCETFINEVQFLGNAFLMYHGFSVGLKDCVIPKAAEEKMTFQIEKHFMEAQLHHESIRTPHILEMSISNILSNTRNTCMKIAKDCLGETNNFLSTVTSGAKGDYFNITQIMAMLGQQNFQGQRIQPVMSGNRRTLPHFPLHDIQDPLRKFGSKGFIRNSFLKGLDPTEFWYHSITGREGITDTAMKSVTWETPIVIVENGRCYYTPIGKWIDAKLATNVQAIEYSTERRMESLAIGGVVIPTTDAQGHVSWGEVSSITRHDPGKELFEIKTRGGRSVTVTESKSLLIWDNVSMHFHEVFTEDIQIGDLLPVTAMLPSPQEPNITTIDGGAYEEIIACGTGKEVIGFLIGCILSRKGVFDESGNLTVSCMPFEMSSRGRHELEWSTIQDGTVCLHASSMTQHLQQLVEESGNCVPDFVFTAPLDFIHGFLKGIFGDTEMSSLDDKGTHEYNCPVSSRRLADGVNMVLSRVAIFGEVCRMSLEVQDHPSFQVSVRGRYATQLRRVLDCCGSVHEEILAPTPWSQDDTTYYQTINDIVMDPVISIDRISVKDHPKVYDLTIPSTLNFGLANGLQVRDTATSGYIQRRMVKVAEDVQVKYDDTVRNSAGNILQFQYGYNSYDPSQSVIVKDKEGSPKMFFADVSSIVSRLNYQYENQPQLSQNDDKK